MERKLLQSSEQNQSERIKAVNWDVWFGEIIQLDPSKLFGCFHSYLSTSLRFQQLMHYHKKQRGQKHRCKHWQNQDTQSKHNLQLIHI